MGSIIRIKFYVIAYFVYECDDGVWVGFSCIVHDQNVIHVSCVKC